jgi:rhodanese-related sulfurtransferase
MALASTTRAHPDDAVRRVSAEALLQELRSSVPLTLIDVRERSEVRATGTLKDARGIPHFQLASRVDELAPLRSQRVVLLSETGLRARTAASTLEAAGFEEIVVLDHGLKRWLALGYPVEERCESVPASMRP